MTDFTTEFDDERRILLRMADGEDRRLLAEWLSEEPGLFPVVAQSDDALNATFDLCFVDAASVRGAGAAIAARKRMEPTFLPCLLLVPERMSESAEQALARLPDDVTDAVDDVIHAPIRKRELKRRLRTLLRARDYSRTLERSRGRYHRLLELTPEAVFVCRDGTIDFVNEASIHLLGHEEPTLVGSALLEYVDEADQQTVARHLRHVREHRSTDFVEARLRSAGGGTVPVEIGGGHLDGDDPATQVLVRDVSRRKAREQRLAVLDRVLRHNLRNRLTVALQSANDIASATGDDAVRDDAERIQEVALSLLELSDDADRLDAVLRQEPMDEAACDLVAVVEEAVGDVGDDRVGVETTLPETAPVAPRECVELAVSELLDNAVRHGDSPTVSVTVEADAETVELRVADDGPGIPAAARETLLGDPPAPQDTDGRIGLWLVRWAVERAGGAVHYRENDPQGSVVIVRFPRAPTSERMTTGGSRERSRDEF